MIAYLNGKLLTKATNTAIIDVAGVGYEVQIPLSTYYEMGEIGNVIALYIHTHVREDAIQLFGFRRPLEKELFLRLISISGVGPKLALTLLSGLNPDELVRAIAGNNLVQLTAIPGVGRKTAERLVIELRDKLKNLSLDETVTSPTASKVSGDLALKSDLVSALVNLGWQQLLAEKVVSTTLKEEENHDFQWLLKQSLKRLYK
jgi:Holliday junction DNA helicase RuvA